MKKLIITALLAFGAISISSAQVVSNNLGLRLGPGTEISYQHGLNSSNRIEFGLGFNFGNNSGFIASGVYQWVFEIGSGFNWYVGPGVGLGTWSDDFAVGLLGQIGVEYNFGIPLQLSIDWRPRFMFVTGDGDGIHSGWNGVALGIRYRF